MNNWFDAEQHVERAHRLYEAGRWEEAESELRNAIALDPYQSEWHFNLGLTLEARGLYRDAIGSFRDASRLSPADPHSPLMVGINHLRLGEAQQSLSWLEQAGGVDPNLIDVYVHRIEAHARLGQHDQAEVVFYMAQQVDAKNAEIFASMADSLISRGLHERAVWCLREAARLDPELPGIQSRLADAFAASGRHERARQLYLLELRQNPGDIATLLSLSDVLARMGRRTEAEEKLRRVLEMEPDHAAAHVALGELSLQAGQDLAALKHYDVAHRLDPSHPKARRRIAGLLLSRRPWRDADRARELLTLELAALEEDPTSGYTDRSRVAELGVLLLDAEMPAQAKSIFRRLASEKPDDAPAQHLLSLACLQLGETEAGMNAARAALKLDRSLVPAMHNLAMAYVKQRQWWRARYWVRQGLGVAPEDAALRRLRVMIRWRRLFSAVGALTRLVTPINRRRA